MVWLIPDGEAYDELVGGTIDPGTYRNLSLLSAYRTFGFGCLHAKELVRRKESALEGYDPD